MSAQGAAEGAAVESTVPVRVQAKLVREVEALGRELINSVLQKACPCPLRSESD
jgi:carbon monoxide dehydrogenase subunit G